MRRSLFSLLALLGMMFILSARPTPVLGNDLDAYYLQAFGHGGTARAKSLATPQPLRGFRCGTPLKIGLQRDFTRLSLSTQKILAKYLKAPTLADEATYLSPAGHFRIHYATSGNDAPPLTDLNGNGVPEWVESVAAVFETVYDHYTLTYGWRPAPVVGGGPYELYLLDLAAQEIYGQTTSGSRLNTAGFPYAYGSYIELDNDFLDHIYLGYTPLQNLQITASHEYHHAIQFGYNLYFDVWYGEATATWYEDELYDSINQLYLYLTDWTVNSTLSLDYFNSATAMDDGTGYGRWLFNRFLAERYGIPFIRSVWEALAPLAPPSGGDDIPMVPLIDNLCKLRSSSLNNDYFEFTRTLYLRDWQTHTNELARIPVWTPQSTTTIYPLSSGATPLTLNHYAFNLHRFLPAGGAPSPLSVTVRATSGIKATLFRKQLSGTIEELPIITSANGTTTTVTFTAATTSEVMLLVANASNVDSHQYSYSTDGSMAAITEPDSTPASSLPATTSSSSSSGGGGGCFIATAAYGSYLHPKVQVLRTFRDRFLLSNEPGKLLVKMYYKLSPPVADIISRHSQLRTATRWALTPVVLTVEHPLLACFLMLVIAGGMFFAAFRHRSLKRPIN